MRGLSPYNISRELPLPIKKKTLVLDLDETLIHSTTRSTPDYNVRIEVVIDRTACLFYVSKRPYTDYFLETVIFFFFFFEN